MTNLDPSTIAILESLTVSDRAKLAAFLIDSLESETEIDSEDAWDDEIARRIADLRTGKTITVSKRDALKMIMAENDEPETT